MAYIPHTQSDEKAMTDVIGVMGTDDLFADIPEKIRFKGDLALPEPLNEMQLRTKLEAIADENLSDGAIFLGAGAYHHYIPSAVGHVTGISGFYTAYTPYQAEISQGTLTAIFEYQTMIAALTGMDVSNASVYDGATAVAEAALMAMRSVRKRNKILVSAGLHPQYREVLDTYANFCGFTVDEIPLVNGLTALDDIKYKMGSDVAALIVSQINFFGYIEDLSGMAADAGLVP